MERRIKLERDARFSEVRVSHQGSTAVCHCVGTLDVEAGTQLALGPTKPYHVVNGQEIGTEVPVVQIHHSGDPMPRMVLANGVLRK